VLIFLLVVKVHIITYLFITRPVWDELFQKRLNGVDREWKKKILWNLNQTNVQKNQPWAT
jgi:hypothetical protein